MVTFGFIILYLTLVGCLSAYLMVFVDDVEVAIPTLIVFPLVAVGVTLLSTIHTLKIYSEAEEG